MTFPGLFRNFLQNVKCHLNPRRERQPLSQSANALPSGAPSHSRSPPCPPPSSFSRVPEHEGTAKKSMVPNNEPVSHPSHLGHLQAGDSTRGDGIEKGKTPEPLGRTRRHKIAHVIGTTLQNSKPVTDDIWCST